MKSLAFVCVLMIFVCCQDKKVTPVTPASGPYFPNVKTIIAASCLSCHSATGSWTGRPTVFDTDVQIVASAHAIKATVADPLSPTNHRMPQGGTLSQADINTIVAWYNAGGLATD